MQKNNNQQRKKRPVWRTVYRVIIFLLISLLVGSLIYSFNAKHVMHEQMPMPLGIGVSYVLSPSMEPTLHVDDLVVVRKAGSYEVGDIIIFQDGSSLTIHRIVEKDGDTLVTKGDNNNAADPPISRSSVKGKMVFSVGKVGALVRWLQTTMASSLAKILLILLAALLLKLSWNKEKTNDDKQLEDLKEEIRRLKAEQYPDSVPQTAETADSSDETGQ